ncbi:XdhC family protein [Pontibacter rugosus]|uniref:XdhC family protein n=1 Tax=Pontibacter rugosus TaxID=1745966 RepID=A0ABW3SP87_9BACT
MKEIKDIVSAYDEARAEGKSTALATVVHVQGSSYRRPGARMLVTEDGKLTGAISGGCLEGDALRKARLVMLQQKPMLVTYDTTDEDDAKLGVGLGCNGIIQILIEPINTENPDNPVALLKAFLANRQQVVILTLFSLENKKAAQMGTCLFLDKQGSIRSTCKDKGLQEKLLADAQEAMILSKSIFRSYEAEEQLTAFVEVLKPAVSLVIAGAGNDAMPLVQMAHVLGWKITVVDGRANYATAERFPLADQVLVLKAQQVLEHVAVDEQTVVILLTHNYNYDLEMLRQLLPLPLHYIGALGPKKKLERMLEELEEEGVSITAEQIGKVYGPTGLDIGAETAEEIALSILAEIKATLAHKQGKPLRDRQEPIHPRKNDVLEQIQQV